MWHKERKFEGNCYWVGGEKEKNTDSLSVISHKKPHFILLCDRSCSPNSSKAGMLTDKGVAYHYINLDFLSEDLRNKVCNEVFGHDYGYVDPKICEKIRKDIEEEIVH